MVILSILMLVLILLQSPVLPYVYGANIAFYSLYSPPSGISLEALIAKWWNWWITVPSEKSLNWPDCLIGQGGTIDKNESVLFLANPSAGIEENRKRIDQNCVFFSNQSIFFPLYNGECDTGQYEGKTYSELKTCAESSNSGANLKVYVDGEDVTLNNFVLYTSKTFNLIIPKVNAYSTQPGSFPAVGGGWYIFLKPLPPGNHEIYYKYDRPSASERGEAKYKLTVEP